MELLRFVSQDVGLLGEVIRPRALEVDICEDFGSSAQLRESGEVGFVFLPEKCVCGRKRGVEDLEKYARSQSLATGRVQL